MGHPKASCSGKSRPPAGEFLSGSGFTRHEQAADRFDADDAWAVIRSGLKVAAIAVTSSTPRWNPTAWLWQLQRLRRARVNVRCKQSVALIWLARLGGI